MKKVLTIALILAMVFTLTACAGSPAANTGTGNNNANTDNANNTNQVAETPNEPDTPPSESNTPPSPPATQSDAYELALITDLGTIDDRSFNQGAWEGVVQYATENNIPHKYYKPADQGDDAYLNAIDLAVQGGAKVVVTPGYLFEVPIFQAQDIYKNVKFILLDGAPNNGNYDAFETKISDNTVSITYAEEQSGFLAGYAAVMDGYRKLGFMGGMAVPAVIRFGHGYIQGADYAAAELGLAAGSVSINYYYTGTFAPAPEIASMAAAWYNDGIEVIFSCGGGICFSIFPAADNSGNVVIGVDGDQSGESPTVITSAMKLLTKSVYDKLVQFYDGSFPGGKAEIYSAANLGVGLPMETSKFKTFNQAQYDAIYAKLQDGTIVVDNNTEIRPDQVKTTIVTVNNLG